jgi:hypothetical protein
MDLNKFSKECAAWLTKCNYKEDVTAEGYLRLRNLHKIKDKSKFIREFNDIKDRLTYNGDKDKDKEVAFDPEEYFMPEYTGDAASITEIINESQKQAASRQRQQDYNRIERKTWRTSARWENALTDLLSSFKGLLVKHGFHNPTVRKEDTSDAEMIVHITDAHFNELIDCDFNKYDFTIAAKRLYKYADSIIKYARAHKINKVVLGFTGDMLNSDRRPDEYLSQATNRASALYLATDIIKQFMQHLVTSGLKLRVVSVSGNESRIPQNLGSVDAVFTDNYDNMLFNNMKLVFKDCPDINFITTDSAEAVVNICGQDILFLHGITLKNTDIEKGIQQIMGKYATRGINLRYIILGHLHSARIGDYYARGSALCGANQYANRLLQLVGRASQNIFIVKQDGSIDGIKVDLQCCESEKGHYTIQENLDAYCAKSIEKMNKATNFSKLLPKG